MIVVFIIILIVIFIVVIIILVFIVCRRLDGRLDRLNNLVVQQIAEDEPHTSTR